MIMQFNKLLPIITAATDAMKRVRTLRSMMNHGGYYYRIYFG